VVEIDVCNSNSTIPESEQARVFERSYRGVDARQVSGTGMGLAIVQQIARAHGVTLTVSSSGAAEATLTHALPRDAAIGAAIGPAVWLEGAIS
jgi:signal transduction histidine kinase